MVVGEFKENTILFLPVKYQYLPFYKQTSYFGNKYTCQHTRPLT